ncbi:MAG: KGK domain-containing protein [Nostoc sp.]|uniref:KGK domain-containing protein n=1 Tax=Nostoc sp. TaxID=1180 RepID=UPI002FF75317
MNKEIILYDDDVVSMDKVVSFTGNATSTCGELIESLKDLAFGESTSQRNEIADGIICKVLLTKGGGWQKGKLRLRLDFVPDEPEVPQPILSVVPSEPQSPLDDLRSHLA